MPDPIAEADAFHDALNELMASYHNGMLSRADFEFGIRNLYPNPAPNPSPNRAEKEMVGPPPRADHRDTRRLEPRVIPNTITLVDTSDGPTKRFKAFEDRDQALGYAMARIQAEVFEIELITIDRDLPF